MKAIQCPTLGAGSDAKTADANFTISSPRFNSAFCLPSQQISPLSNADPRAPSRSHPGLKHPASQRLTRNPTSTAASKTAYVYPYRPLTQTALNKPHNPIPKHPRKAPRDTKPSHNNQRTKPGALHANETDGQDAQTSHDTPKPIHTFMPLTRVPGGRFAQYGKPRDSDFSSESRGEPWR